MPSGHEHPDKRSTRKCDFDNLQKTDIQADRPDVLLIGLGTNRKAVGGSIETFRKVDQEYVGAFLVTNHCLPTNAMRRLADNETGGQFRKNGSYGLQAETGLLLILGCGYKG